MNMDEAYSGADLAGWHGKIERSLINLRDRYESSHNRAYADKLGEFLRLWRSYPIEGSVNIEGLTPLDAAASQLAVDDWKLSGYFSQLRDKVRQIIASTQELPDYDAGFTPSGRGKRMGSGSGSPPSSFGPEKIPGDADMPPGMDKLKDGPDPLKPEPKKRPGEEIGDSEISIARKILDYVGNPVSMFAVQSDPVLSEALNLGMLKYDYDTGNYYVNDVDRIMEMAGDYDVGDQVVVAYNGKPVTGTVSKRKPDGSYELSFDNADKDRPDKPVSYKKDQLRSTSNAKPPAQLGKPNNGTQARQFYGTGS